MYLDIGPILSSAAIWAAASTTMSHCARGDAAKVLALTGALTTMRSVGVIPGHVHMCHILTAISAQVGSG